MATLFDVVESVVSRMGVEVEDLKRAKAGSRAVIRITVDGDGTSGRGLNLDEVAAVSQEISRVLDDTNVMGDAAYVLEVGTPGVDRPLVKPVQWRRNLGRLVTVTRTVGEALTARILGVDDQGVQLSDGVSLDYSQITKAVVQVEMNRDDDEEEE